MIWEELETGLKLGRPDPAGLYCVKCSDVISGALIQLLQEMKSDNL